MALYVVPIACLSVRPHLAPFAISVLLVQCDLADSRPRLSCCLVSALCGSVSAAEPVELQVVEPPRSRLGPGPGDYSAHDDAKRAGAEHSHACVGVPPHFVPTVSPVGLSEGSLEGSEADIHSPVIADGPS